MALRHLGTNVGVESLIKAFEAKDHFRTYEGERNPSISANCNVLTCLLMMDDPTVYAHQIIKTAKFLCEQVHTDSVREKWVSASFLNDHRRQILTGRPSTSTNFIG